ncbi:putative HNHc nuclease [Globicatella sanguinis]
MTEIRAEIVNLEGKFATIRLIDEIDEAVLEENAHGGRYFVYLEPLIKDTTTDDQRKHWFALIKDISDYTGEDSWKVILKMKYLYMMTYDTKKEPSLARNKMKRDDVTKLLQLVIDYCLSNDIPLRKNYLPLMEQKQLFAMTMKRICWITHKPNAELCHFEQTVGMGRNRNSIDHTRSKFMTLSHELHMEQHRIGEQSFCEKYNIQPIGLTAENLKELGVM